MSIVGKIAACITDRDNESEFCGICGARIDCPDNYVEVNGDPAHDYCVRSGQAIARQFQRRRDRR